MTGDGGLVEVQATAERTPLSRAHLDELLALAQSGIETLREAQAASRRVILSTRNAHKLREFRRLLGDAVALEPLPDGVEMPPETGDDLRRERPDQGPRRRGGDRPHGDRRRLRHRGRGDRLAPRASAPPATPARARRTPRTSRSCGPRLPPGSRLRYVVRHRAVDPDGARAAVRGRLHGRRWPRRRAASAGFGYDPVFLPDAVGDGRTMAELDDAEKDAVSHRGAAARALRAGLGQDAGRSGMAGKGWVRMPAATPWRISAGIRPDYPPRSDARPIEPAPSPMPSVSAGTTTPPGPPGTHRQRRLIAADNPTAARTPAYP